MSKFPLKEEEFQEIIVTLIAHNNALQSQLSADLAKPTTVIPTLFPSENIEVDNSHDQLGTPMSPEELAQYFKEQPPKLQKEMDFVGMTKEQIEDWERKQDNSNDIYKIAARVKNLARVDGLASLTPTGEILCNTYTHVIKAFYDFADTLQDKNEKIRLYQLIQVNENMPGRLISANVGTKGKRS